MTDRRDLVPAARELLQLARRDRERAKAELARLGTEEQAAVLCEAPLGLRAMLLDLVEAPEALIPLLPEAELCFTCKHVGVHDAAWMLAHATDQQIVACVDLDAWKGLTPDIARLDSWLDCLAEAGDETLLRGAQALDPELLALYLRDHVRVQLKPSGDEDWQPEPGAETLEGQFYFSAIRPNDDIAALKRLLHCLFQKDYWLYFRMLQAVGEELQGELEEWALRWRTGRLEDLGFPSWDHSMRIYGHLRPERCADLPREANALDATAWSMPVWITDLPAAADSRHTLFRAVASLDLEERRAFFFAFIALANQIAVADRLDLGDAGTLPGTIEKAAAVASRGLEFVAGEHGLDWVETLRRVPVERLFRVGVNLAPEDVRPPFSDEEEQEQATDGERDPHEELH